jgi:hypothetical protein
MRKRLTFLGIMAPVVVAICLIMAQGIVSALDTSADVSSTNAPPNIECKWELPDMDSHTEGIQYDDDDMPLDYPVDPATGAEGGPACVGAPATQADGWSSMIQVKPNQEDQPEERRIELWAAVDHEAGVQAISDVYWKVFHPDESFKVQVHGTKVEQFPHPDKVDCADLGTSSAEGTVMGEAYDTGQVSATSIDDDANGLVALCSEGSKAIYYAEFNLSKHQPCGSYKVELHAVSSGAEDVLVNYIDVLCVFYLELDFEQVDWGTIYPGITKVVPGDTIFSLDPTVSSMPTVKNTGNSGMGVAIEYEPMVQVEADGSPVPGGKIIDEFDACFGTSYSSLYCVDPITSADEIVPLYSAGTTDISIRQI